MAHVVYDDYPKLANSILVAAFSGWPDSQQASSRDLHYVLRRLPASKFAEIDPEEFYVFSRIRPLSQPALDDTDDLQWPSNKFYSWKNKTDKQDFVFLVGSEPNLRWRTFSQAILDVADRCNVKEFVLLGSRQRNIPHTRPPLVTGVTTREERRSFFDSLGFEKAKRTGPASISSVLREACAEKRMDYTSLWTFLPEYLQGTQNPRGSLTLLQALTRMLNLEIEMSELEEAPRAFANQISRGITQNIEWQQLLRELEERYDRRSQAQMSDPRNGPSNPDVVIEDLEAFLRQQKQRLGNEDPNSP